eukprot:6212350-Pleurochrysis_carterae.AAC.5
MEGRIRFKVLMTVNGTNRCSAGPVSLDTDSCLASAAVPHPVSASPRAPACLSLSPCRMLSPPLPVVCFAPPPPCMCDEQRLVLQWPMSGLYNYFVQFIYSSDSFSTVFGFGERCVHCFFSL